MSVQTGRSTMQAAPRRGRRAPRDILRFLVLSLFAALFLAPIYWMVSTSLKPEADTIAQPVQWIPAHPTLSNYLEVLNSPDGNILRWTWNSLLVASLFTVLHLILCTLTAYPLARMNFPGRNAWFWFILSSLMIPGIVTLVPTYLMMIQFNWINSYNSLIWPGISGVFGVFLLRQFFVGIPKELEEAARLDGANSFQVLTNVILPLAVPALVTLGVFAFMGSWNNFLWPSFVVTDPDKMTLPVGITTFSQRYVTDYGKLMASTALAAVPVLIAYLIAQRYLVAGLATSGMKE
ncbi:MAG: carbohydrate ABC transporter permease [Deinococcus sp.]